MTKNPDLWIRHDLAVGVRMQVSERNGVGPRLGQVGSRLAAPSHGLLVALWVLAAVSLAIHVWSQFRAPVLPGDPWQLQGKLTDFRDTIWVPGQFLLGGGNPYDTDAQLASAPWTQGLRLYAPAWLLLAVALAPLPYLVGAFVYQLLGIAVVLVLVRVTLRMALPRWVSVGTPVLMVWLTLWAPGRFAMENVSSALVVLGVILVLRGVWLARVAANSGDPSPAVGATAAGIALSLIKPQFGLFMLVLGLAGRRWDAVWRGVVGMTVVSVPATVVYIAQSGGVGGFLASVERNLAAASSPEHTAGLSSPYNVRIDLVGQLGRLGIEPAGWIQIAVLVLSVVLVGWFARRACSMFALSAGVACALLLGIVHQFYDLLVLLLPLLIGIGWLLERRRVAMSERAQWIAVALPAVHVHRVSVALVPGLTLTGAARIDTALLMIGLALGLARAVAGRDRLGDAPSGGRTSIHSSTGTNERANRAAVPPALS